MIDPSGNSRRSITNMCCLIFEDCFRYRERPSKKPDIGLTAFACQNIVDKVYLGKLVIGNSFQIGKPYLGRDGLVLHMAHLLNHFN